MEAIVIQLSKYSQWYRKEKFVAVEEINVTTFIRNEVEFSE